MNCIHRLLGEQSLLNTFVSHKQHIHMYNYSSMLCNVCYTYSPHRSLAILTTNNAPHIKVQRKHQCLEVLLSITSSPIYGCWTWQYGRLCCQMQFICTYGSHLLPCVVTLTFLPQREYCIASHHLPPTVCFSKYFHRGNMGFEIDIRIRTFLSSLLTNIFYVIRLSTFICILKSNWLQSVTWCDAPQKSINQRVMTSPYLTLAYNILNKVPLDSVWTW